jgi:hypothetical protein
MTNLRKGRQYPSWNVNPVHPEYKSRAVSKSVGCSLIYAGQKILVIYIIMIVKTTILSISDFFFLLFTSSLEYEYVWQINLYAFMHILITNV